MTDDSLDAITLGCTGTWPACASGWFPLLRRLDTDLRTIGPTYKAAQVKEKFGVLRFDSYPSMDLSGVKRDKFYRLVEKTELASATICEECGDPGTTGPNHHGWLRTLCQQHASETPPSSI